MKKLLLFAALVLGTVSCMKDNSFDANVGGEADVVLSVALPADVTRALNADSAKGAIGNIDLAQYDIRYILEVFDASNTLAKRVENYEDTATSTTFELRLIPGRHYSFVVWADFVAQGSKDALHYNAEDLRKIQIIGAQNAMDESRDAYTGIFRTSDNGGQPFSSSSQISFELKRPFAKLRVVTNDIDEIYSELQSAEIEYTVATYQQFDALKKTASEPSLVTKSVNYTKEAYLYAGEPTAEGEQTLFADYIFGTENGTVQFVMTVTDNVEEFDPINFNTAIPVQANYLTTIKGAILTDPGKVTVEIVHAFENGSEWNPGDDEHDVEVWDGVSISEPAYVAETNSYVVDTPSELAWFAAFVNGTLPTENTPSTFATRAANNAANFVLEADIDLGNQDWTPIGTSANPYKGVFDGNGKKISNLVVSGGSESNKGLFGVTHDGEIKNLTIENACVSGRLNIGVVAGQPYTTKYTNITVQGHVEINGMAYVGGVGGKNAYADWTNITVNVDETSYVKANSVEDGTAYRTYVGGVVGFNGEGGHSFKNITSNINVIGSTIDVGGLFGIAHYNNKFENCVCTGNVEIYAAEEAEEAQEIGGIAGVWHNENGTSVEFANCVFEGALTTNVEGVNFCYGGLVGKAYSETGTGKLLLNGVEFNKDGVNADFINAELAAGRGFVMPFDLTFKATASNAYGATGLNQLNGGILDGAGHTLKVTGANGTWGSAINTTGGTIKNITVAGGFRGIFVNHNSSHSEKVVLENVTINGPTYTISCDQGMYQGLEATGCTINGWTSYAATIGEVKFTNCSFGKGAGYKFARPYAKTLFEGCNFCEGYAIDARAEVKFVNCTLNGVALTTENLATLVTGNVANAKIVSTVSTSEELVAALAAGCDVVFANDITVAATDGGYHKAGILQDKAQTINGNGYALTVTGAGATWDCAIYTNGGVIKNLTVKGAMRGIFTAGTSADLYIENVKFENVIYTFNSDGGNKNYGVYVSDSVVNGWTSHSNVHKEVVYTNCSFGEGSGYKYCRPYGPTSFVNCTFCPGYTVDKSQTTEITFTDCIFEE